MRASRGHPLSKAEEDAEPKEERVRRRIEHVFGAEQMHAGWPPYEIGIVRARAEDRIADLVYNIRRLVILNAWPPHERGVEL